jgi:hypothetical protein
MKISKGKKGTDCDTDLEMKRTNDNLFELQKGFLGLLINKKQARDLMKWLKEELKDDTSK